MKGETQLPGYTETSCVLKSNEITIRHMRETNYHG